MKIQNLVELLNSLNDPNADIRTCDRLFDDIDDSVLDIMDIKIEKHLKTGITHYYLVLGCDEPALKPQATPPRPYRASD